MYPIHPIDEQLPMQLAPGVTIFRFAKPCPACRTLVSARAMRGVLRHIEHHAALAAEARCPQCGHVFPVCCVIDAHKHVRRIALPLVLWRTYLRLIPPQPAERAAHSTVAPVVAESAAPATASAADYLRAESVIGHYQGKPIPAWIEVDGRRLPFDRVEPEGRVAVGEFLIDGYFVYKAA
jgi:hypothetical protein